jgi:hypothetical protein
MECSKIAADVPVVTRRAPDWAERDRALQDIAISRQRYPTRRRVREHPFRGWPPARSLDEIERGNWIPFRSLVGGGAFTILRHAPLTALDAERPISFLERIGSGLLRRRWGQEGVLVTDDLGMGEVYDSRPASPRPALNIGVDRILVSYDPVQYFILP